jgi:hypothetical protein
VLAAAFLLVPSAAATPRGLKLLVRHGNSLALVYLDRATPFTQPLNPARARALAFSGDGNLLSIGGSIPGRNVELPTRTLTWAPSGERAAYITTQGGVVEWTPAGLKRIEPNGWGADWGLAWSDDGALAVSRRNELWVIRGRRARRVLGPLPPNIGTGGPDIAIPFAWAGDHILWWDWPGSGSIAADGVSLYEDGTKLGTTLMYPEYTAACGTHVAFAQGGDRYSTDGKTLVFDGRTVAASRQWSWVEPACTASGTLVAARSRNIVPRLTNETHRSLWQLLPTEKQLTRPPWGWSDEDPRLFANGDLLFVRSRTTSRKTGPASWIDTQSGRVMLLSHGKLQQVATIGFTQPSDVFTFDGQYYGRYDWSQLLAVWP